jgi:hypothetical protein
LEKIYEALEKKISTAGIFLDLSKAYDVINHKILLDKLEAYGIRGVVKQWFKSYLIGRRQCVEIKYIGKKKTILEKCLSGLKEIKNGVPQGSILGPVLFQLYINNLTTNILEAETVLVADDTNILIQAEDGKVLEQKINSTMEVLYNWVDTNGLVINTEKSIALSFHTWQNKIPLKPQIIFNKRDVNYSTETKFLGLHLTECLKWEAHIRYLSILLNKSFYVLQSLKYTTGTNIWRGMYLAHFRSCIRYGIIFGGNNGESKNIFKPQKRVI